MAAPVELPRARVFANFTPDRVDAGIPQIPRVPAGAAKVYATFDPEVWERSRDALRQDGLLAPPPPAAPVGSDLSDLQLLAGIKSLLSPDNFQTQNKYLTAQ